MPDRAEAANSAEPVPVADCCSETQPRPSPSPAASLRVRRPPRWPQRPCVSDRPGHGRRCPSPPTARRLRAEPERGRAVRERAGLRPAQDRVDRRGEHEERPRPGECSSPPGRSCLCWTSPAGPGGHRRVMRARQGGPGVARHGPEHALEVQYAAADRAGAQQRVDARTTRPPSRRPAVGAQLGSREQTPVPSADSWATRGRSGAVARSRLAMPSRPPRPGRPADGPA